MFFNSYSFVASTSTTWKRENARVETKWNDLELCSKILLFGLTFDSPIRIKKSTSFARRLIGQSNVTLT